MLTFEILLPAFLACLVLAPLLSYLGMHVLARGVIFIDIALAQLAALGAATGAYFGFEPHTPASYVCSFAFAVAGSALVAGARGLRDRVPQEALIGIIYAVGSALAVLVASALPHGDEEIKDALVGTLLTVSLSEVAIVAAVVAIAGAAHLVLRRRFLTLSFDPKRAEELGWSVSLWELLLYVTFAVVITAAVQVAGVLLVFSFLIVPAVFSALFAQRLRARLMIAWIVGPVVSVAGLVLSYRFDLPTGASIVVVFGAILALGVIVAISVAARAGAREAEPLVDREVPDEAS
jgi:zinc/manganese transport system permease protein